MIANNRTGANFIPVNELYSYLSQPNLDLMWMEYDSFMYGGGGKDSPLGGILGNVLSGKGGGALGDILGGLLGGKK